MKKLYFFFSLCLALLGFTTANAQAVLTNMDPMCGAVESMPSKVTLTFSEDIAAVGVYQFMSATSAAGGDLLMEENSYTISGKELTLNLPESVTSLQDMLLVLQVADVNGSPVSFSNYPGYEQPGMMFIYYNVPVKADLFAMESSNPAAGVVEKLDTIYVTFNDATSTAAKKFVGGFDTSKKVILLDSWNDVVATATMEIVKENNAKTTTAKFILDNEVSIADTYTLIIPEGTVYNERFDVNADDFGVMAGATYNPETRITYTVAAPVVPTTIENAGGSNGNITTTTSTLEIIFSAPIAKVNTVAFQAMFGEFPPMVEGTDYSFYDNVLTINIPTEYLANAANVPAEYRTLILALNVEDVNGNIVTYSNSTHYPQEAAEQMGMSFLQYNVIPATTVTAITPECGFLENGLESTVTLTFSADIKAVEYGTIRTQLTGFRGYIMSEDDYVIEGNKLTINVPAEFIENQSAMQIRMNVIDANDMYVTYAFDPEYGYDGAIILEWTAPVKSDLYNMVSSDPAAGEVEKLDVINVTFADAFEAVIGGFDTSKTVVVLNAAGDTVTTAAMEVVQEEGWNTNTAKFTLATPVTEVGEYTFVIPAATVYNEMFYEWAEDFGVEQMGALYNPEVRIAYTISIVNGIESVTVNNKSGVYTLDGRKVNGGKLVKGVYVINGKKVYVK